jgi:hypothetical protein
MPDPAFESVSFDGILLVIKINFVDSKALSGSLNVKKDFIHFNFNTT